MEKIYFTITGTGYRFGHDFIEAGMKVRIEKEPENEIDREAIAVYMEGLGKIGYVANSVMTVLGESWSAGRIYDKIGDTAEATVMYVLDRGVICTVDQKEE